MDGAAAVGLPYAEMPTAQARLALSLPLSLSHLQSAKVRPMIRDAPPTSLLPSALMLSADSPRAQRQAGRAGQSGEQRSYLADLT